MIVIDSSAIIAAIEQEDTAPAIYDCLDHGGVVVGAPTRLEASIVVTARSGAAGLRNLDAWIRAADITTIEFTPEHSGIALDGFWRFGKGRHRASLNYGDCMSYALTRALGCPLLFVGDDFTHTDISPAIT